MVLAGLGLYLIPYSLRYTISFCWMVNMKSMAKRESHVMGAYSYRCDPIFVDEVNTELLDAGTTWSTAAAATNAGLAVLNNIAPALGDIIGSFGPIQAHN